MLRDLQREVMKEITSAAPSCQAIANIYIEETDKGAKGLQVYQDSYQGVLVRALKEIYPVFYKLVGERFFITVAIQYIRRYPSIHYSLERYGRFLNEVARNFAGLEDYPYLMDVIKLEWAWHRAFNSAPGVNSNIDKLGLVSEQAFSNLILFLPKTCFLIKSEFPIHRIWHANQHGERTEPCINLDDGGVKLFVSRKGLQVVIDVIERNEMWVFLQKLSHNQPFINICDYFNEHYPDIMIGELLGECLSHQWLTSFKVND